MGLNSHQKLGLDGLHHQEFGLSHSQKTTWFSFVNFNERILMVVYVDDIVITGDESDDAQGITDLK